MFPGGISSLETETVCIVWKTAENQLLKTADFILSFLLKKEKK